MKPLLLIATAVAALAAYAPPLSAATNAPAPTQAGAAAAAALVPVAAAPWYVDRFELGTRFSQADLEEPTRSEGFIGTITELDVQQDAVPYNVVVNVLLTRWLAIGGMWDQLRAETVTDTDDQHSDGDFVVEGPQLTAVLRWPRPARIIPYVEYGIAFSDATFEPAGWWGGGYPSQDAYVAAGSPDPSQSSKQRHIDVDNSNGTVLSGGLLITLGYGWSLDLEARYVDLDADAHYYITQGGAVIDDRGLYDIPLSYTAYSVGARYTF